MGEREPRPQEDDEILKEIQEELDRAEAKKIYLNQLKEIIERRKQSRTTGHN